MIQKFNICLVHLYILICCYYCIIIFYQHMGFPQVTQIVFVSALGLELLIAAKNILMNSHLYSNTQILLEEGSHCFPLSKPPLPGQFGNYLETVLLSKLGRGFLLVSRGWRPGTMVDLLQAQDSFPPPLTEDCSSSKCQSVMLRLEHPEKNKWLITACITTTMGYNQLSLRLQSQSWFSVSQGYTHGHVGKATCREHHGLAWQGETLCFFETLLLDASSR